MRCVVQRVREARVTIEGRCVGEIGCGLLVLAAVELGDGEAERAWMAEKLVHLRIFPDADGKMNRSVLDLGSSNGAAGILLISNFTVAGECSKGRRPGFDRAMKPPEAKEQFDQLLAAVRSLGAPHGVRVETGEFGADMRVSLVNDGPVTLVIESPRRPGGTPASAAGGTLGAS